jgi:protein SCO1/2
MRCRNLLLFVILMLLAAHGPHGLASAEEVTEGSSHESDQSPAVPMHEPHDHEAMQKESAADTEIGVYEHLGDQIPLDIVFVDEQGRELAIGEAITKPTLVLPIFFSCTVTLELGRHYGVIAFSFDEEDGPDVARESKGNFTKILKQELPREEWRFLTGEEESIRSLTDALGFKFKRIGPQMFIHPNVMIALAPDGTIIRYLYGPRFLPFDIGMALTEAAKGTPGLSIRRLLTYCFDYDPESKSYMVRSFRLLALGIVALLGILFFFIVRKK